MSDTFLIIPCSGIGKPFGSISREATYQVVENLRKSEADTLCLSLLVKGDKETQLSVKTHRCIAVDGCPNECSKKSLEVSGANLAANFRVIDCLRENRKLRPREVTFLDEDGRKLSGILADKIALKIDELKPKGAV